MKKELNLNGEFQVEENEEVIKCGEAKLIKAREYEEDGKMYTEETLQLLDPDGRASTIRVKYTAGANSIQVTFSSSGHGSNVWCSYQVGSRIPTAGGDYNIAFSTTRYAKDVERHFSNVSVAHRVPAYSNEANEYIFYKYIRNSSSQSKPTRTYQWSRYLRGTGSTN